MIATLQIISVLTILDLHPTQKSQILLFMQINKVDQHILHLYTETYQAI